MADMSELRRLQEESRREAETADAVRGTLNAVLDMVPIAFVAMAQDARILYASPAYERTVGGTGADLSGYAWYTMIHPEDQERIVRGFSQFVEGDDPTREWSAVCRFTRLNDGEASEPVMVTAKVVGARVGGVPSVVLVFQFRGACLVDPDVKCLYTGTTRWQDRLGKVQEPDLDITSQG